MAIGGATLGAIICIAFAGLWAVLGAAGLHRPWRQLLVAVSIALLVFTIISLLQPHPARAGLFRGDVYLAAVAFEIVGIIVAVAILRRLHRREYILPVVGFIVGLHFLGMWKATDLFVFVWTAVGMCLVSVIALVLPAPVGESVDLRRAVAGFGSALVLYATGTFGLGGSANAAGSSHSHTTPPRIHAIALALEYP